MVKRLKPSWWPYAFSYEGLSYASADGRPYLGFSDRTCCRQGQEKLDLRRCIQIDSPPTIQLEIFTRKFAEIASICRQLRQIGVKNFTTFVLRLRSPELRLALRLQISQTLMLYRPHKIAIFFTNFIRPAQLASRWPTSSASVT